MQQQRLLIGCNSNLQRDLYEYVFKSQGVQTSRTSLSQLLDAVNSTRPNVIFISCDTIGPKITSAIRYAKKLRHGPVQAILCVTRSNCEAARQNAISAGADEVLAEPMSLAEILERLRAFLTQTITSEEQRFLVSRDIKLDLQAHAAFRGQRAVALTPTEFHLLEYLMARPETPIGRHEFIDHLWGRNAHVDVRTVDVSVNRLRRALSKDGELDPICSVRGHGYVFRY